MCGGQVCVCVYVCMQESGVMVERVCWDVGGAYLTIHHREGWRRGNECMDVGVMQWKRGE